MSFSLCRRRRQNPPRQVHDLQIVEPRNSAFSIQQAREMTNNFSEKNVLIRTKPICRIDGSMFGITGKFLVVYKGELEDGTKISIKMYDCIRQELADGISEDRITFLKKFQHQNLVSFLGWSLNEGRPFFVYEYMGQGSLSRHIFNPAAEGLPPLEWTRRLMIALDVARGIQYLHYVAGYMHINLKPNNILLGDNLRAKVADFCLVYLAPMGTDYCHTRIYGTKGYLAPEMRVGPFPRTTKMDVYSFGVILMELIAGRKVVDISKPDESKWLLPWFMEIWKCKSPSLLIAVDSTIDVREEETVASITAAGDLANLCCETNPEERPGINYAVSVLSSLLNEREADG